MDWYKLSESKPAESECPSQRVLVYFPDYGVYDTWGIRSEVWNYCRQPHLVYWMYIPEPPKYETITSA